jgi:TPR repeat protein
MYSVGRDVPKDSAEALKWFGRAAAQGHEAGKVALAAEMGDAAAQYKLSEMFNAGLGGPPDTDKSFTWFWRAAESYRTAAEAGDAAAQFKLGEMTSGDDLAEALKWFGKAAAQGHEVGKVALAAGKGDVAAQYKLAEMYNSGLGGPPDSIKASTWYRRAAESYRKAAEQGSVDAQYQLGMMLINGKAEAKNWNPYEAAKLILKAAEQGLASAQVALGRLYAQGAEGVRKDSAEAAKWFGQAAAQFRLSAEKGDATAQVGLAELYRSGDGVPKDPAEALKWFRLSAAQGNQHAIKALQKDKAAAPVVK